MKKFVILLLMVSIAFPLESIGMYDDEFVVVSDSYVLKISENLNTPANIQNKFSVNLAPVITVDDGLIEFSANLPVGIFDNPESSYVIENSDVISNMYITEKITIEGKQIISELSVKNTGTETVKMNVAYNLDGIGGEFTLFSPKNYNEQTSKYMVALQTDYEGLALAAISSEVLEPSFEGLFNTNSYILFFSIPEIEPEQTFLMQINFYPFVLKREGFSEYPDDLYAFLENPLITTSGSGPEEEVSGSLEEKIESIMDLADMLPKKESAFYSLHDVNFDSDGFDSLDSSAYFKQLCIKNDVPCRLIIGKTEETYYAWISAYAGEWVDIDVQNGMLETPQYTVVYRDPKTEVHLMPFSDDEEKMIYEGTVWISTIGQMGFLMYFIIIIVIASGAIVAFQFKKVIKNTLSANKGRVEKAAVDVDGKYEVLSEEIEDTFLREIIKRIKDKDGFVKVDQLVETMHFSKELIQDGVAYLVDQKFIKKIM